MKKLLLLAAIAATGFCAKAQFSYGPAIDLGTTNAKKTGETQPNQDPNRSYKSEGSFIFGVGGEVRYRFSDIFSIHSGLFYQNLTEKFNRKSPVDNWSDKYQLNYITLPIKIVYGKDNGIYGGVGIDLSLGISGKYTYTGITTTASTTIKFDGNNNATDANYHFKGLNSNVTGTIGYKFDEFFVGLNAGLGIANNSPYANTTYKSFFIDR